MLSRLLADNMLKSTSLGDSIDRLDDDAKPQRERDEK